MPLDLSLSALFSGNKTYFGVFFSALFTTLVLTPLVIRLALHFKVVDRPNPRKVHPNAKPLLGGLAIFCGLWLPILSVFGLKNLVTASLLSQQHQLLILFLAGLAMLLQGAWDDVRSLNANWKFSIQIPVAIALVCAGVRFESLTVPGLGTVGLGEWGSLITVLWLVGMSNALNLVDGIDGLATGVAFFACATNAVISALSGNHFLAVAMCAMAGACLGFLRYNFSPARIFLGDTGSQFIGMTLAVISTQSNTKGPLTASLLIPMVILGYPLVDTMLAIARRKIRGKPVFSADREHIHHRLLALGLNHRLASMILYGVCLLFSALAISLTLQNNMLSMTLIICLSGVLLWGVYRLGYVHLLSSKELTQERLLFQAAHQISALVQTRLQLADSKETVFELLRQTAQDFGAAGMVVGWKPGAAPVLRQEFVRGPDGILHAPTNRKSTLHVPRPDLEEHLTFGAGELDAHLYFCGKAISGDLLMEHKSLLSVIFGAAWQRLKEIHTVDQAAESSSDATVPVPPPNPATKTFPAPHLS